MSTILVCSDAAVSHRLLAGKPAAPYLSYEAEVAKAAEVIRSITSESNSPAQTAIRLFAKSSPGQCGNGHQNIGTIKDIAAAADFHHFPTGNWLLIKAVPASYYTHR
ncbi:hypothetical protein CS542_02905 [Pedobacter sp. IW39]|nr:hypothetical protein CS542_02905 [Pedobacter sp. IW39]